MRQGSNRLANETSAYLLQHSRNPVDWHPWGEEALSRAREEDKPLLISIGYSACHWCHVMEQESFEDPETAALMNRLYVCIKVDREERPDVDQVYMDAVTRLTGGGGWPLTVFCRPDGSPFYGGTYFPDEPRGGLPSFRQVLSSLADVYDSRREDVDQAAEQILQALAQKLEGPASATPGVPALQSGARLIMRSADRQRGGFGEGPKFPTPTNLELLLTALDFLPREEARPMAEHCTLTCQEMARRGLYDQLGGGFYRYCVDGGWTIPHFEKMLYDQGLLLRSYSEVWRRSGGADELVWPMRETVDYLRREMAAPDGGFYASQDADSEGEEGRYHVWTPQQLEAVLGERAGAFGEAYGVTAQGNFEGGRTHLIDLARGPREEFAEERALLLGVRQQRVPPATDHKRVAAWNGYVISGLARVGSLLDDPEIVADAAEAADFVLQEMLDDDGRLLRIYDRGRAHVPAFLDDHAALLDACLELYRAGAGERFLAPALHLAAEIGERFFDPEAGDLFFTPVDAEALVHRPRSDHDGATPNAAGLACLGLIRAAQLSGSHSLQSIAERVVESYAPEIERVPHAHPTLLRGVALLARGVSLAIIVGDPKMPDSAALVLRARRTLLPDDAVVVVPPGADAPRGVDPRWLEGREPADNKATAYICRGTQCSLPITNPDDLEAIEERT
ncbi:MAG: thioredoxin domain-containing protein [Deltaproteobacteria bacterium]|nr:thioredoxin domain-containing protein [Deltaproteobacteria bacterium]